MCYGKASAHSRLIHLRYISFETLASQFPSLAHLNLLIKAFDDDFAWQSFSRPLVFLSIATAVSSAIEEVNNATEERTLNRLAALDDPTHEDSEDSEEAIPSTDQIALTLHLLKEELEDKGITLPER